MKVYDLKNYTKGWFMGDFEPSLFKTPDFEVGFHTYEKGQYWAPHVHKVSDEYNLLIEGKMVVCGQEVNEGQLFVIEKNEVAGPTFLENCKVLIIKVPSVPGDKYIVEAEEESL